MGNFKFRLQKVLDLRTWREQESAARLGAARQRMSEAERAAEALREVRASGNANLLRAHSEGGPVGQLQNLNYLLARIDQQIAEADAARLEAEKSVQASMNDYLKALREKRTLERLRDRQAELDRIRRGQAENRVMDDLAVSRFVRKAAGEAAEG